MTGIRFRDRPPARPGPHSAGRPLTPEAGQAPERTDRTGREQEDVGKGWGKVAVLVVGMVVGRFLVLNVTMRDRTIRTNQPLACLQSPLRYGRDAWASVWQPPEAPAGVERHMPQRVKTQPVSISDVLGGAA